MGNKPTGTSHLPTGDTETLKSPSLLMVMVGEPPVTF